MSDIATKNGEVIFKDGAAAENCNCCETTCRVVVRSVRVKLTTPPQTANDDVDSGTSIITTQSFVSAADAKQQAVSVTNASRGSYRTQSLPTLDWITLLPDPLNTTTCGPCTYSATTNDISLEMQGGFTRDFYSEWTVVLDLCQTVPREVAVVGYKAPVRVSREFPIALFTESDPRLKVVPPAIPSDPWFASFDGKGFDSRGLCWVGNTVPYKAYTAAGGGGVATSGSVDYLLGGVVESINPSLRLAKPYASGVLSYSITGAANGGTTWTNIPGLFGTGLAGGGYSEWDYAPLRPPQRPVRCRKYITVSQQCGIDIEVVVA